MNISKKITVVEALVMSSVIFTGGCANTQYDRRYSGNGYMEYSNVQYIYGTNQPVMSYDELSKYNGIRIGPDGYVKSLVQLPQTERKDLPYYDYTPPAYFRDSYARERGWKK